MLDHVSLGVRNQEAARTFYGATLAPLGHDLAVSGAAELGFGPGGMSPGFFLYEVAGDRVAGLGSHVAFSAPRRLAVDEAYAAAIAGGASSIRPAGLHQDIAPTYYGAIFLDPDGNKLEIVALG